MFTPSFIPRGGGGGGGGGGVLQISSDGDDRMGAKIKKKSLDQKLTPKTSHAKFPSPKNFQKALNDITRKLKTLEIECLCLFIHHII